MQLWAAFGRNKRKTAAITVYALVTTAIVGGRWLQYADAASLFVPLARASAAGIYLNCALVLLPMMRLALSRRLFGFLWRLLPVHKAIEAHTIAGTAILAFCSLHVAAYAGLWLGEGELFASLARPLPLWTGLVLALLYALLGFSYRSGDYAFLCVPTLSRLQWHPFSLINAPSDVAGLSFRIRLAGSWTTELALLGPGTPVHIDGPFASPCRDLHGCTKVIIVAGGIGITPFVSFLAEIRASGTVPFERIHLYWLERDVDSFRAFRPLLDGLERRLGGILTVTLVAGSAGEGSVPRLVTTQAIEWDRELARLTSEGGLDGATLFFCGPPGLSSLLRAATRRAGLKFRTESF